MVRMMRHDILKYTKKVSDENEAWPEDEHHLRVWIIFLVRGKMHIAILI